MNAPKTAHQLNSPFMGQYQWKKNSEPTHTHITPVLPEVKCGRGITFEFHVWASADTKEGDPCKCGKVKWTKIKT